MRFMVFLYEKAANHNLLWIQLTSDSCRCSFSIVISLPRRRSADSPESSFLHQSGTDCAEHC